VEDAGHHLRHARRAEKWIRIRNVGQSRRGEVLCCIANGLPLATFNVKDFRDFAEYHGLDLITV
jgi:predicted nucleic acid-binding protein